MKILKTVLLLLALLTGVAMVRGAYISGPLNNTTIFLGGITAGLLAYCYFFNRLIKIKWLNYFLVLSVASVCLSSIILWVYGNRQTTDFTQPVAIVLGAGTRHGEALGPLSNRLDQALVFFEKNPDVLFIVSGGQGHRMTQTEASIMAQYLTRGGVPPAQIILENYAYSTHSNMGYATLILQDMFGPAPIPPVAVITNNFHMYRAVRFARQHGLDPVMHPAPTPFSAAPLAYVREIASVVKMWAIGR